MAQAWLASARVIAFVGFGYLETNLANLCAREVCSGGRKVFGSGFAVFEAQRQASHQLLPGIALGHQSHRLLPFFDNHPALTWVQPNG